jgi:membrane protease YdiL (CAAX protease family)
MPFILFFILLVVLIAQVGFWDTLSAVLGGIAMVLLFLLVLAALVALGGWLAYRRALGSWRRRF